MTPSWQIDRRHVLRGLGSFISLPLLECMRPAFAGTAPRPKRSVFVYIPNGVNTLDYQIVTPGKAFDFSRTLKPLEKHRGVVTPISGLHHPGGIGLAEKGYVQALKDDPHLLNGLNVHKGVVTNEPVATELGHAFTAPAEALV